MIRECDAWIGLRIRTGKGKPEGRLILTCGVGWVQVDDHTSCHLCEYQTKGGLADGKDEGE